MTLVYCDDRFLDHDTGSHPERAERLRAIIEYMKAAGQWERCGQGRMRPATVDEVARVHERDYIESVRRFCAAGGGHIDVDTVLCPASYDVALLAAGAGVEAVNQIVGHGADKTAVCLVRPPGHHATARFAMGFCVFNNIAVAARQAIAEHGVERVMIIDWDVHHGNGTQETFYEDPRVAFLSAHRFPFYPGTGSADERDPLGLTCNLPIMLGTPRDVYLELIDTHATKLAERFRPELVLVSAGYDGHAADPIGSIGLENDDFAALSRLCLHVAEKYAAGRCISFLEGGYNLRVLAECNALHVEAMLGEGSL
jgi:acetoin utilization deacetylase AcuC-like enzyme